jgi:hypothetical protein
MGDRGNIKVYQDAAGKKDAIYLYTHWDGSEIEDVVSKVLSRRVRWYDGPYLTRMLFCKLVEGDEGGETGFGISTSLGDNEHDIIGINPEKEMGEITIETEDGEVKRRMTFEEYLTK